MNRQADAGRARYRRTREVFLAVRELGEADRVRRLAEIAAEEPEVAREARELLAQLRDEDPFLAQPMALQGASATSLGSPRSADTPPAERIDGCRLPTPPPSWRHWRRRAKPAS